MTGEVSRRDFFRTAGAVGAGAALGGNALAAPPKEARPQPAPHATPHAATGPADAASPPVFQFFNAPEAAFVEAAISRLIPADDRWPGALETGVATYIDRQLAGAYGAGARIYLQGPWKTGTPRQGYQLPFTPAQLYRTAIADIGRHVAAQSGGKSFRDLPPDRQDAVLEDLESGAIDLPHVPAAVFFETLLANTIEGFFADPIYGGNRDMAAWRMIGFPGAYATYVDEVENHGKRLERAPLSIMTVAAVEPHRG